VRPLRVRVRGGVVGDVLGDVRLMASSSMRTAVENHFGVKLEFQNCCKVAAFAPAAIDGEAHKDFVSLRAQLLNQKPELINC
jgi:hypothetical protein